MTALDALLHGDAVSVAVAWTLVLMSVASWMVILWKFWTLRLARHALARSLAAFWQAPDWTRAQEVLPLWDTQALLEPLVQATRVDTRGSLAGGADRVHQLTRLLRDALHGVLHRLHAGQVLLATVGATAPFVGLLGTVWGIYHALVGLSGAVALTLDRVAGPVGEALIMTAGGLMVAIPAVIAYNASGRAIGRLEADLEGFARDLRELVLTMERA